MDVRKVVLPFLNEDIGKDFVGGIPRINEVRERSWGGPFQEIFDAFVPRRGAVDRSDFSSEGRTRRFI